MNKIPKNCKNIIKNLSNLDISKVLDKKIQKKEGF